MLRCSAYSSSRVLTAVAVGRGGGGWAVAVGRGGGGWARRWRLGAAVAPAPSLDLRDFLDLMVPEPGDDFSGCYL